MKLPAGRILRFRLLVALVFLLAMTPLVIYSLLNNDAFMSWVGAGIVRNDAPRAADLVVVMGGDFWGPRVHKAAELVQNRYAPKALISGPIYGNENIPTQPEGELAIQMLVREGQPRDRFESFLIEGGSTLDEVRELAPELSRRKVKSVLLVTSDYHSRRACTAFFLEMPHIQCICIAAPDPVLRLEYWWLNPKQKTLVQGEWIKYAGTLALRAPLLPIRWLF